MASSTDNKFSTERKDKDFTLYTHDNGPNGWKISHAFEELGLEYESHFLNFMAGEHKGAEYTKINPNGRIPAIVDHKRNDFVVWESGAILLYLVKHYDPEYKLWSKDDDEQSHILEWLFFQVSGFGPYIGQAFWFSFYHKEKIPSAVDRYVNEVKRVLSVLEGHLSKPENKGYLAAGKYTIADLSFISWMELVPKFPINVDSEYPAVSEWFKKISRREGTLKGFVGGPYEKKD